MTIPHLHNQPFLTQGDRHGSHLCLLLHGLGGGVYEMQPLARSLQEQGYSTCALLYPGHDRQADKMPNSRWEEWYGSVAHTYQTLASQYQSVSILGFSTGCLLALNLVLNLPQNQISSLVLMAPYLLIRRRWYYLLPPEVYLYSLGYLMSDLPRLTLPIRDPQMRQAALNAAFFQTFNLAAVRSTNQLIDRLKPRLGEIATPTLIFQSHADSVVHPNGAQQLYDRLGSDCKTLHWLHQSDHILPLDLEREQIFQIVHQFLPNFSPLNP
ncbi:alpha/beta hydrolase [Lyngbya confervoides]|uniref:Alpha/beta fold hydrolase n=1 Tax=Lyngbya confervoides BDU141951 TaxID=1574623 RepID=A0ABD4T550_9CYAN|nr:alpha/beta fold hydrolase [Lyngbya confervoides]MCM1983367.1 alpha/beta fold hydrolase [Lyngbya confervoides BDU141951]